MEILDELLSRLDELAIAWPEDKLTSSEVVAWVNGYLQCRHDLEVAIEEMKNGN